MSRDYGQYCGLARALDVVGDRWNLLIVRQLLVAPLRYQALHDGLPGVATNLLADRLRDLEAAGVIERRLAEHGNAVEYALTPWGLGLREPIEGFIRWSAPLMMRGPGSDTFRSEWLLVALPALLSNKTTKGPAATVGVDVDDQLFQVRVTDSGTEVNRHDGRELDAILRADPSIILGLAAGALTLDQARDQIDIQGKTSAMRAVFER